MQGGDIIGNGVYGCVFQPSLKCKTDRNSVLTTGTNVSKILSESEANLEIGITTRIQQLPLWQNYFIVAEKMCQPATRDRQYEKNLNKCGLISGKSIGNFRILKMRYGGIPLFQYRSKFTMESFYNFTVHIIEAISVLNIYGIVHKDLHRGNILIDDIGVPRIIDFNLSINTLNPIMIGHLRHEVNYTITQESPDSMLVNAIADGVKNIDNIIHNIISSDASRLIENILGISIFEMKNDLYDFYKSSRSVQGGQDVTWMSMYWPVQDSWAVGIIILHMLSVLLQKKSFIHGNIDKTYKQLIFNAVRGMCQINPMKRISAVKALSIFSPGSDILNLPGADKWIL